jgi:hypothetical protein
MAHMLRVTPIDEVVDGKTIVHPPLLVGMIKKIEDSSYDMKPAPVDPAVTKPPAAASATPASTAKIEPVLPPPATVNPTVDPAIVHVVQTTITFADGNVMHVKEPWALLESMMELVAVRS